MQVMQHSTFDVCGRSERTSAEVLKILGNHIVNSSAQMRQYMITNHWLVVWVTSAVVEMLRLVEGVVIAVVTMTNMIDYHIQHDMYTCTSQFVNRCRIWCCKQDM